MLLKMEDLYERSASVFRVKQYIYQLKRHNIREDLDLQHRFENLTYRAVILLWFVRKFLISF
jgi:hypothetical protein